MSERFRLLLPLRHKISQRPLPQHSPPPSPLPNFSKSEEESTLLQPRLQHSPEEYPLPASHLPPDFRCREEMLICLREASEIRNSQTQPSAASLLAEPWEP